MTIKTETFKPYLKTLRVLIASLLLLPLNLITQAHAAPPLISYQGRMTDSQNDPETGTFSMNFIIEDFAGAPQWSETQSVNVVNGVFSVLLGAGTIVTKSIFNDSDELYVKVVVAGQTLGDRQKLLASPYAINAGSVKWANIPDIPDDIKDGNDAVGLTSISWGIIDNIPPSLTDGNDDVGIPESEISGMIAFFEGTCPSGWDNYTNLHGRTVLSLPSTSDLEAQVGTALNNNQDRLHSHSSTPHEHSYSFSISGTSADPVPPLKTEEEPNHRHDSGSYSYSTNHDHEVRTNNPQTSNNISKHKHQYGGDGSSFTNGRTGSHQHRYSKVAGRTGDGSGGSITGSSEFDGKHDHGAAHGHPLSFDISGTVTDNASGNTGNEKIGFPYIQLRACQKL